MRSLRQSIKRAEDRGVEVLGSLVQWSVPSKTTIKRDDMLKFYTAENLSIATIPAAPGWETALRRAVQRFNTGSKIKLKRVKKDSISHYYAAYELAEDGDKISVNSEPRGYVELDMGGKLLFSDPTAENEWGMRLRGFMTQDLDCNDIRNSMKAIIHRCNAFPTRPTGGAYFVPVSNSGALDSLNRAVKEISSDISVVMLPILGDDRTKADLSDSFTGAMIRNIEQMKERLDDFFSDGKVKQASSSVRKLDEITRIRGLATSYSALLECELTDVDSKMRKLEKFASDKLKAALSGKEEQLTKEEKELVDSLSGAIKDSKKKEPTAEEVEALLGSV